MFSAGVPNIVVNVVRVKYLARIRIWIGAMGMVVVCTIETVYRIDENAWPFETWLYNLQNSTAKIF